MKNIDFDLWTNIKEEMKSKSLVDQIMIFVYAEQGTLTLDLKGYE